MNHLICTTPDTEQVVILMLHFFFNHSKTHKNVICTKQFPYGTAKQIRVKNCTLKFTFKKQI